MPLTNAEVDLAVPAAGTPDRTLTNAALKELIVDVAAAYNPGGTDVAVTDGGTGRSTSTTAYGLIAAGTTATGAHQTLAAGATTEVLVGGGAAALPVWTTATGTGAPVRAGAPTFTSSVTAGAAGGTTGSYVLKGTTSGTVTLTVGAAAGTYTLTLPADDGTADQFLKTDGAGALTWSTPAGSGDVSKVGTPANTQVGVWTGDGTIEGDAAFTFDTATDALLIGAGSITRAGAHLATITTTGTTGVTLPTTGTLATLAGTESLSAKTLVAPIISGISTSDGASVTTANAIGALAIDVTKGLNTKSISTESTFTFSGTPATANTWFGIHVTNSDTAPHILTFPSAFSQVSQAARTTCPIAASGQLYLLFRYDGSAYKVFGDGPNLSKFDATAAPGVTDDLDLGYGAGSLWLDATGNATYICESAANGAAVWHGLGGSIADGAVTLAKMADLAQDQFIVRTTASTGVPQTATVTAAARTVLDDTTTGAMLTTLGAQPVDADLTTIAGLTATTDNFLQSKSSAWASRTVSQVLTDLQGTGSAVDTAGFRGLPQNSQSAAYTTVLADAGRHLYHPSADTTARTFTIASNASVAYPIGTTLTFINDEDAGVLTIAINSDTLMFAGSGASGSRTLAENGIATAVKMTSTRWMINGTGLT